MSSRAPDAEDVSVVLVGSFNPGIFHPAWFERQEILLPQEVGDAKLKVISPEVTEVLFLDMKLDVLPDRFVLETHDASRADQLHDIVVNVLTRLPHTPVTACGLNNGLYFDLKDEAYWHKIGHALAPKELIWNELLDKPGMTSLAIKGIRNGDFPGEVNVAVSPWKSSKIAHGIVVNSNFHFSVPRDKSGTAKSELVLPYIEKEWKNALEQARLVAYRIFDQIKKDTP